MRTVWLAAAVVIGMACLGVRGQEGAASKPAATQPYRYGVPETTGDGWEVAGCADVGLDVRLITQMFNRIGDGTYKNIHGVVLIKDGKLVAESYFTGRDVRGGEQTFTRDALHSVQSVTKSVNSILVGIAIDRQLIKGVDDKLATYLPEYADQFAQEGKNAIRLKDCLSMTAGLTWDESKFPYTDPRNDHVGMNRSPDPVRYVLERPMAAKPGERFVYHSGISITLGEVVHKVTGMPTDEFARRELFGPLGITEYRWAKMGSGHVQTGGGLLLRPRDMAKIGLLYLNGGRWAGRQIVSESWVKESTRQQTPYRGYGYQWWLRNLRGREHAVDVFAAQGLGGQFIIVVPELKMVGVFTGWNDGPLIEQPYDMMQRYVVPAVEAR